jgi:hypothetical protein
MQKSKKASISALTSAELANPLKTSKSFFETRGSLEVFCSHIINKYKQLAVNLYGEN